VLLAGVMMLAALAFFVPATLLDARLKNATMGELRLADTDGSVWNGRGILTNEQRTLSLPVRWQVSPWSLLRGGVEVALHGLDGDGLPRGDVEWRDATMTVDGLSLALPAAAFVTGETLALGGNLAIDAPHLRWSASGGDGAATLQWSGARVTGNTATLALGTVTVDLVPHDGRLEGRIENRGGEIRVDGDLAWSEGSLGVNATLTPMASAPPSVVRALSALGTPDANGAVRLQWRSGDR
jgi:Type II secretion system (T2SS), protein N